MSNWTGQSRWAYDHQSREANPVATESDKIEFLRRLADQFRSVRGVFDEYAADFTADGLAIPDQLILADVANWVSTHIEDSGEAVTILDFLDVRYPQGHIDVKGFHRGRLCREPREKLGATRSTSARCVGPLPSTPTRHPRITGCDPRQ